jgi:hypothetical protein
MTPNGRVLTAVVYGAGPAAATAALVKLALGRGWRIQVIATPAALEFFDEHAIADQTGTPVRSQYSKTGAPRSQVPDAILVAPASSLSKSAIHPRTTSRSRILHAETPATRQGCSRPARERSGAGGLRPGRVTTLSPFRARIPNRPAGPAAPRAARPTAGARGRQRGRSCCPAAIGAGGQLPYRSAGGAR